MIKTAIVAMTLMGCDCDARLCEFISQTPAKWQTVADCEAAMRSEIKAKGRLDYPLISGFCRADVDDDVVASIAPDRTTPGFDISSPSEPQARSPLYAGVADGTRIVFRKTADGYAMVKDGLESAIEKTVGFAKWSAGKVLPIAATGN